MKVALDGSLLTGLVRSNADAVAHRVVSLPPVLVGLLLAFFFFTILTAAGYTIHQSNEMRRRIESTEVRFDKRVRHLESELSFQSRRRRLTVGIQDEILCVNPAVARQEALHYAELIVAASEKYPTVDPLMLVALGVVESGFDARATSRANARGLFQIWPPTGRRLARVLQLEYEDEMLYDPVVNTEMAALYLDILFSAYNDERLVLAEYNGGPVNAGYLRAGSPLVAEETREYVPKVLQSYGHVEISLGGDLHGRHVRMD